eukprot:XP_014618170.1 uncharacterized protein LOC102664727 [Glycine max]
MLCLQETKKEVIERYMCQTLWGESEVRWEVQPAVNTAGGILCLWSNKTFKLERKVIGTSFVLLVGKWIQEAQTVNIISIYSPCDIQSKRVLWESIKQLKIQSQGGLWCILGDFNSIRNSSESFGVCHRGLEDYGSREFNEWIEELEVEEAPWVGSKWPGSAQYTLERNFSNHFPVLLRSKSIDWGPKPFRIMDCWLSDTSFKKTVEESWTSNQQSG